MALITTFNKSKFNNKHTLSENTWFKYPYIYNIIGGNDILYVYRKDIVNNISELYGTIDISNALDKTSGYYITLHGYTRSENTDKMYVFLRTRVDNNYQIHLFSLDLENLTYTRLYYLYTVYVNDTTDFKCKIVQNGNDLYIYSFLLRSYYNSRYGYRYYQVSYTVNKFSNNTMTNIITQNYSNDQSSQKLPYSAGDTIPSIIDSSNKFLKYGAKTQAGSYIAKAGFTYYENPSTYDTYNSKQYNGGLVLEFNNKYYLIGGYIGTNANTDILELNKNNLEATLVYETTANSNIYMAYTYENNMYIVYTDGTDDYLVTVSLKEYNLKYDISSNDGSKKYVELLNNAPIKAIRFNNVSGTNTVGYVIETLGGTLQGSFEIDKIQNKQLSGFSTIVNATSIQIPLNQRVEINISVDTNFYAVYTTYRPLANTFKLELYNNTSEDNRVDKTNYLTKVGELAGVLREESSLVDMSLTLELEELPLFNYVYIEQLNRYYYVTDIVSVKYKLWTISLSVDVLMSYKNALLSCSAFVDRNENSYDNTIIDKKRVIQQGYDIEVSTVTNELLDNTSTNNIVLTGFYVKSV